MAMLAAIRLASSFPDSPRKKKEADLRTAVITIRVRPILRQKLERPAPDGVPCRDSNPAVVRRSSNHISFRDYLLTIG